MCNLLHVITSLGAREHPRGCGNLNRWPDRVFGVKQRPTAPPGAEAGWRNSRSLFYSSSFSFRIRNPSLGPISLFLLSNSDKLPRRRCNNLTLLFLQFFSSWWWLCWNLIHESLHFNAFLFVFLGRSPSGRGLWLAICFNSPNSTSSLLCWKNPHRWPPEAIRISRLNEN